MGRDRVQPDTGCSTWLTHAEHFNGAALRNDVLDEFVNCNTQLINIFAITFFRIYYRNISAAAFVAEHITTMTCQFTDFFDALESF